MKDGSFIASLDWGLITEWENQLLVKPTIDNNCIIYNIYVAAFMEVLGNEYKVQMATIPPPPPSFPLLILNSHRNEKATLYKGRLQIFRIVCKLNVKDKVYP